MKKPYLNSSNLIFIIIIKKCSQLLLVDPTEKEEAVMNGRMIMAMNIHREICGAVMGGGVSLEADQVLTSVMIC